MAVLSDTSRAEVWAELMRAIERSAGSIGITKAELRAALDATDDWVNANAASFNAALPQPARGTLTSQQKALLLLFVVDKRFVTGV